MKRLFIIFYLVCLSSVVFGQTTEDLLQQGIQYAQKGNYKKALKYYNKVIGQNPVWAEAYYHRGAAYYELQDFQAVIADNKEAIRLKPDYQSAYFNLGICYYRMGEYAQAIEQLTTLIGLQSKDAEAFYWRAMAYKQVKFTKEACEDWKKAQKLGHSNAQEMLRKYCEEENAAETGN